MLHAECWDVWCGFFQVTKEKHPKNFLGVSHLIACYHCPPEQVLDTCLPQKPLPQLLPITRLHVQQRHLKICEGDVEKLLLPLVEDIDHLRWKCVCVAASPLTNLQPFPFLLLLLQTFGSPLPVLEIWLLPRKRWWEKDLAFEWLFSFKNQNLK